MVSSPGADWEEAAWFRESGGAIVSGVGAKNVQKSQTAPINAMRQKRAARRRSLREPPLRAGCDGLVNCSPIPRCQCVTKTRGAVLYLKTTEARGDCN